MLSGPPLIAVASFIYRRDRPVIARNRNVSSPFEHGGFGRVHNHPAASARPRAAL